ncbi:MAG: hypothetical protein AAF491_05780 [Verrucomicrobiota bacterium]
MSSLSFDDVAYAMESTVVAHEPDRRIDTFGTTNFEFHLLTEPMDEVGRVRIREGKMEAERPQILRPDGYEELLFEGFGEQADVFTEWFKHFGNVNLVKYGFNFANREMRESTASEPLEAVRDRIVDDIRVSGNPSRAVILGVDDTWEISLIKFTMEMIASSLEMNAFDFKRRGLL